jgi:hypothetical protein
MNSAQNGRQTGQPISRRRAVFGSILISFCVFVMIAGAIVKTLHPAKVVAYMGSMGYQGATLFLIAALELLCAIMFLLPPTRIYGLLLVSAYFGGAISAHLAHHPPVIGGPFLMYMSTHPYIGSFVPSLVLAGAWVGVWLRHPEMLPVRNIVPGETEPSRRSKSGTAVLARS